MPPFTAAWQARVVVVLAVAVLLAGSRIAAAQSRVPTRKWEVGIHGGWVLPTNPPDGTAALPLEGPTFTVPCSQCAQGVATSRRVPSWYFGDGAFLLNQALTSFGARIASLDPVLGAPFVHRQTGGSVGVRVGRALTPRLTAEFTFDYSAEPLTLTSNSTSGLEASRASFVTVLNGLLTPPSRATQTVKSDVTIADSRGRQIVTAGTLLVNVLPVARFVPYVAFGAGMVSIRSPSPNARLVGDYWFSFPPEIGIQGLAIHETDTVTVRSSIANSVVWVFGGGLKYPVSERWGIRVDVRDRANANTTVTLVDAAPASTGVSAVIWGTTPALIFGSRDPSLSGTPISGFKTFGGTGTEHHINLSAGVFWRF